jgi:hypothetical protein
MSLPFPRIPTSPIAGNGTVVGSAASGGKLFFRIEGQEN